MLQDVWDGLSSIPVLVPFPSLSSSHPQSCSHPYFHSSLDPFPLSPSPLLSHPHPISTPTSSLPPFPYLFPTLPPSPPSIPILDPISTPHSNPFFHPSLSPSPHPVPIPTPAPVPLSPSKSCQRTRAEPSRAVLGRGPAASHFPKSFPINYSGSCSSKGTLARASLLGSSSSPPPRGQ